MKAFVYETYGAPDVLRLMCLAKPIPQKDEVLIRLHATTVTSGDSRVRSLRMPVGLGLIARIALGFFRPRRPILGTELAGEIEAVGSEVVNFKAGDQVFAFGGTSMGCHAEYKCMRETGMLALKPRNLTPDEAAALSFGGTTALDFFRRGNLKRGEKVLINGASGSVGTAAVQLARYFGADVTGVCSSANLEMVRSLGADHVIDYTEEDFTKNGEVYDVIMDTAGTAPYFRSKGSLRPGGRLLLVLAGLPDMLAIPWVSMTTTRAIVAGVAAECQEDLLFLAELAEAGHFRPVIDRRFAFEQIVEAHQYVDSGRKKGNVVVTLG
ncbi:MAG: NAD(P)-dependent alcohol dehydrogenase [Lysobacteraceae bacterium]|nr:MAG: NAD(P)-dependent alcohol dehydrogenase [Xanthomonadaceae bacterium]